MACSAYYKKSDIQTLQCVSVIQSVKVVLQNLRGYNVTRKLLSVSTIVDISYPLFFSIIANESMMLGAFNATLKYCVGWSGMAPKCSHLLYE